MVNAVPAASRRRPARLLVALLVAGLSAAPAASGPVAAQEADDRIAVDVLPSRPWFGPGSPITFTLAIRNLTTTPIDDLRLTAAIYERVRSRSALDQVFLGRLPSTPLEAFSVRLPDLVGRDARSVRIEQPPEVLEALQDSPEGVYPLVVTVRRSTGPSLAGATTAVAFLTGEPPRPLRLLPVARFAPDPLIGPDGTPRASTERTVADLGRVVGGMDAVDVPFGLAVPPLVIEDLAHLSAFDLDADPASVLDGLRRLAADRELLTVPRSWARLPDLSATELAEELEAGTVTLRRLLDAEPRPVLLPPSLSLDAEAVEALEGAGVAGALARGTELSRSAITPAEPLLSDDVLLLPTDEGIGRRVASASRGVDVSRAVAESAMVFFESPGRTRTLALIFDADRAGRAFLESVGRAPWLDVIGPTEALGLDGTTRDPRWDEGDEPPEQYLQSVRSAAATLDDLASFAMPGNDLLARLRTALGWGRSTASWDEDWSAARAWNTALAETARDQRALVTVSGGPVTFTSSRGEVPITVMNGTEYPIRVRVTVTSPKVRFPEGDTRVIEDLGPPGETVTFPAIAESSGTFPLEVSVTSPDDEITVATEQVLIRSTAVNVVAVVLTIGAAVFLAFWYGRRLFRRGDEERSARPRTPTHA